MSYKSFTFKQLKEQFGLQQSISSIFRTAEIIPVEPSDWLRKTLEIAAHTALTTEKERSERIVSPILLESREHNNRQFSIFSGALFDVDITRGLNGECDFLLSCVPFDFEIQVPVFALIEAKRGEIEPGLSQCAAQMVAAKIFNDRANNPISTIFGCVTTGDVWRFLKLAGDNLTIDADVYYLNNLSVILGVLQAIVDSYKT
ncbi:MAG: hypothetical protein ACRC62_11160 [Microcoleus sp.]